MVMHMTGTGMMAGIIRAIPTDTMSMVTETNTTVTATVTAMTATATERITVMTGPGIMTETAHMILKAVSMNIRMRKPSAPQRNWRGTLPLCRFL